MLIVDNPRDLKQHVGRDLTPSDWVTVDQDMIDRFAEATGDDQWIHVDVHRAQQDSPVGSTIAHGYLTLSLLVSMTRQVYAIRNQSRLVNYGSDRVRFTNVVPAGSRIRLRQELTSVEEIGGDGVRIVANCVVEIDGQERPALVAETITVAYA